MRRIVRRAMGTCGGQSRGMGVRMVFAWKVVEGVEGKEGKGVLDVLVAMIDVGRVVERWIRRVERRAAPEGLVASFSFFTSVFLVSFPFGCFDSSVVVDVERRDQ